MKYHGDVYKKDKYENPFYKSEGELNKRGVLWAIFLIIVSYLFYLVFYSSYFKITQIIINDLEYVNKNEIQTIVEAQLSRRKMVFLKQDRYFLLDKDKLKEDLARNFYIEGVKISSPDINCLEIHIDEKKSSITWISQGKYYYLDKDGFIKREVPATEVDRNYLIVYDGNDQRVNDKNKQVIPGNHIQKALEISEEIRKNLPLEILSFIYLTKDSPEIHAKTNKGFEIYFDLTSDIEEQLSNFYVIYKELKSQSVGYVDLRFGKRVYYK